MASVKFFREMGMQGITYGFPSARVCGGQVKLEYVSIYHSYGVCGGVGSTLDGGLGASSQADVTRERESAGIMVTGTACYRE